MNTEQADDPNEEVISQPPIDDTLIRLDSRFSANINALRLFANTIGPVADHHDHEVAKDILETITYATGGDPKKLPESGLSLSYDDDPEDKPPSEKAIHITDPKVVNKINTLFKLRPNHGSILRRSCLITAVSYIDTLIAELVEFFYSKNREALPADERIISLADLKEMGSIESAESFLISKEVDSVLRGSIGSQIEYLGKRPNVHIKPIIDQLDRLIEIYQRRHLIVHAGGVVNRRYCNTVAKSLREEYDITLGDKLEVDNQYLRRAIDEVHILGVIVCQQCWRKWDRHTAVAADEAVNRHIYENLVDKRNRAAQRLAEFAMELKLSSEIRKRNLILNLAQAHKWQGNQEDAERIVKEHDWTACSLLFQLAVAAINDQHEFFFDLLQRAASSGDITRRQLNDWPIFRGIRELSYYKEKARGVVFSDDERGDPNKN